MPDAVKWLLPIVVGESWPEGDETKLRALRDAWHTASSAIGPASDAGNQAAQGIGANWTGDGADAFAEQWKKFVEGDEAYFKQLADATKALGDSCDQTALDVEYTKYMIIISLIVLAAQIAAMIAAAAVTFGGSTAGIAPAQIATRMTVQMLFRQLLEKLAQQGFKQVDRELGRTYLRQRDLPPARELLSRAVEIDPNDPVAQVNLAKVLELMNDNAGALRAYERAVQLAPSLREAQYGFGMLAGRSGRQGEGFYHLAVASKLEGDYPKALNQFEKAAPLLDADKTRQQDAKKEIEELKEFLGTGFSLR